MVSTHLKNISQTGNLPQVGMKIKHIWNHHLDQDWFLNFGRFGSEDKKQMAWSGSNQRSFLWQHFFCDKKEQDLTCGFFGKWLISSKLRWETAKKKHKFPFVHWYNVARKFKSPENTAMKVKLNGTNIQLLPLHCKFVVWLPSKPTTCETSLRSQTQTKRLLV